MAPGDDRTTQMTRVVNEARVRASTERPRARSEGRRLVASKTGGHRVVGLGFLQEAPDDGAFDAVLRLVSNSQTAFEMFHALGALRNMADQLPPDQRTIAIDVLIREKDDPREVGVMEDDNLPDLIDEVIEALEGRP
jgi:hypothetical protein